MAKKSGKPKRRSQIQKSLNTAARLLNSSVHRAGSAFPDSNMVAIKAMNANLLEVVVYQAHCTDEDKPLGSPTTDKVIARQTAIAHHDQTGHITDVIESH